MSDDEELMIQNYLRVSGWEYLGRGVWRDPINPKKGYSLVAAQGIQKERDKHEPNRKSR